MYRLNQNNQIEIAPENLPNHSGFDRYLNSLSISERQAKGWYLNVVETDIETPFIDADKDTIFIPRKPVEIVEETPFEFSPLKMEIDLEKRGKELGFDGLALLDGMLNQSGLMRMYQRASVLNSGDTHIKQIMGYFLTAYQWSEIELKQLMQTWKV